MAERQILGILLVRFREELSMETLIEFESNRSA
jgi:hypothetical protein